MQRRSTLLLLLHLWAVGCASPPVTQQVRAPGSEDQVPQQALDVTRLVTRFGSMDPLVDDWPASTDTLHAASGSDANVANSYIVQLAAPVHDDLVAKLRDLGAVVAGFIPDNALWVELTPAQLPGVRALVWVRAVVSAPKMLKVDPRLIEPRDLRLKMRRTRSLRDALVELSSPKHAEAMADYIADLGGVVLPKTSDSDDGIHRVLSVQLTNSVLKELSHHPHVVGIVSRFERKLFNDHSYGLIQGGTLGEAPIWSAGLQGEGQIVAVADTGLHMQSCFFQSPNKVAGYLDWAGNHDGDAIGHGTHVAGSVAGLSTQGPLAHRHSGMAPQAQLLIQDVAAGQDLVGLDSDIMPLLEQAYKAGARIHVDAWGDEDNSYGQDARIIDKFVAMHRDFLVVVANGNAGAEGPASVGSPATAKNVVSVGAIDAMRPDRVAVFSARGPTYDGRIKPTLVAPGVNIVSAMHKGSCRTQRMSGTSMAAPTLAGAAALVRQYFTEGFYPSGRATSADARQPTSALLRAMLIAGAQQVADPRGETPSVMVQGFGQLRLDRIIDRGTGAQRLFISDEKDAPGLTTGASHSFTFEVTQQAAIDVALVWTDVPALPSAGRALVNDLDLTVQCGSSMYLGNGGDHLNVEEVVHIPAGQKGPCIAKVTARLVPLGPQPFALVILAPTVGQLVDKMEGLP